MLSSFMILNGISIVMNVNNILQIRTLGTEYSRSTQTYSCIFLQHFLITVYRRARVLAQSPSVRWSYQYTSVQTSPMHDLVLLKAALPVLALQFRIPLWQLVLILFARKYVRPFCLQSELSDALCGKKKIVFASKEPIIWDRQHMRNHVRIRKQR